MKSYLSKALFVCLALLAPIKAMMITAFCLILADMITGVFAAVKRGEKVRSAKLRNTLTKLLIYEVLIIISYFVQKNLLTDAIPLMSLINGVIAVTEMTSLLENCETLLGTSMFDTLIKKLGSPNLEDAAKTLASEISSSEAPKS